MAEKILRLPAVRAATGLSRSTIYALIQNGTFPSQVRLGARSVGWLASEIETWVEQRVQASRFGEQGAIAASISRRTQATQHRQR